jgi:hypothetical protein
LFRCEEENGPGDSCLGSKNANLLKYGRDCCWSGGARGKRSGCNSAGKKIWLGKKTAVGSAGNEPLRCTCTAEKRKQINAVLSVNTISLLTSGRWLLTKACTCLSFGWIRSRLFSQARTSARIAYGASALDSSGQQFDSRTRVPTRLQKLCKVSARTLKVYVRSVLRADSVCGTLRWALRT